MQQVRHSTAAEHCLPLAQVTRKDLLDDEEYDDIKDDSYWEIQDKYGGIESLEIPRPAAEPALDDPGVGLVFVVFSALDNAIRAQVLSCVLRR